MNKAGKQSSANEVSSDEEEPEDEPEACTEEDHSDYHDNYKFEGQTSFVDNSYLFGQTCAACDKLFVGTKKKASEIDQDREWRPCESHPAYFCVKCYDNRWLPKMKELSATERREWLQKSDGKPLVKLHCFCEPCFSFRRGQCGNTPDSPRKKRDCAKGSKCYS